MDNNKIQVILTDQDADIHYLLLTDEQIRILKWLNDVGIDFSNWRTEFEVTECTKWEEI